MKQLKIENKELLTILERSHYETQAKIEVLKHLFANGKIRTDKDCIEYIIDYDEQFIEYMFLKGRIEQTVVKEFLNIKPIKSINLSKVMDTSKDFYINFQKAFYLAESRKELLASLVKAEISKDGIELVEKSLRNIIKQRDRLMDKFYEEVVSRVQPEDSTGLEWLCVFYEDKLYFYKEHKPFNWKVDFENEEIQIW